MQKKKQHTIQSHPIICQFPTYFNGLHILLYEPSYLQQQSIIIIINYRVGSSVYWILFGRGLSRIDN